MGTWKEQENKSSSNYLKLQGGDNTVRIVSGVEAFGTHWDDSLKKSSVCIGKEDGCADCAAGLKVSPKWLCYVIDRSDGQVKTAEFGWTIVSQVKALSQNPEYIFEEAPPYDMVINKTGEKLDTKYTVLPSRKDTELTEEEKNEISELEPIEDIIAKKKEFTTVEPF